MSKEDAKNTIKRPVARVLYHLYAKRLYKQIDKSILPKHLGVILDGNRRHARVIGITENAGHERGYDNVEKLMRWCWNLGIKELTLYAFSTENFDRNQEEVDHLMTLLCKGCIRLSNSSEIHDNKVKVKAIGRITQLPAELQDAIREVEERTKDYGRFRLNLAIAYGGRAEIIDAVKRIFGKINDGSINIGDVDEVTISDNLYNGDMLEPDMIIRTSGEQRLSGFLLWQSAYSELYFTEANFPVFRKIDFFRAVRNFQLRLRRYGK